METTVLSRERVVQTGHSTTTPRQSPTTTLLEVIKRDGRRVPFDKSKITIAIEKAMNSSSGIYEAGQAAQIADEIESYAAVVRTPMTIHSIEEMVYYKLTMYGNIATAKAYESYRSVQEFKRQSNTNDSKIGRASCRERV